MKRIASAILVLISVLLLMGCILQIPGDGLCYVYYNGNGNTSGSPPIDNRAYNTGDTIVVMDKPDTLKNGDHAFLG